MTQNHAQLAAILAALLPELKWRHHGIGVLQAYVRENVEPEVRVHIWDPRLVREGIRDCGDAHDHRFDLESTVIVGEIKETVYLSGLCWPHYFGNGARFDVWNVENARSAADRGFDGECALSSFVGQPFGTTDRTHSAGSTYTLPRGVFHRTEVEQLTVTLCTMREKRGQARILVPTGKEPVHAFGEPAPEKLQARIIAEAIEILDRAAVRSF